MKRGPPGSLRVLLLARAGLAGARSEAEAAEVVKMGDLPAISNGGLYVAIEKGFFAEKNITIDAERFASGAKK